MTNKEKFMMYARKRIIEKNSRADKECNAYFKESSNKNKKTWNVRFGGYRY